VRVNTHVVFGDAWTVAADLQISPVSKAINVTFWEWEKIPRLQAKTLVGLRHEKLPQDIT
jgi:hypothetical protein